MSKKGKIKNGELLCLAAINSCIDKDAIRENIVSSADRVSYHGEPYVRRSPWKTVGITVCLMLLVTVLAIGSVVLRNSSQRTADEPEMITSGDISETADTPESIITSDEDSDEDTEAVIQSRYPSDTAEMQNLITFEEGNLQLTGESSLDNFIEAYKSGESSSATVIYWQEEYDNKRETTYFYAKSYIELNCENGQGFWRSREPIRYNDTIISFTDPQFEPFDGIESIYADPWSMYAGYDRTVFKEYWLTINGQRFDTMIMSFYKPEYNKLDSKEVEPSFVMNYGDFKFIMRWPLSYFTSRTAEDFAEESDDRLYPTTKGNIRYAMEQFGEYTDLSDYQAEYDKFVAEAERYIYDGGRRYEGYTVDEGVTLPSIGQYISKDGEYTLNENVNVAAMITLDMLCEYMMNNIGYQGSNEHPLLNIRDIRVSSELRFDYGMSGGYKYSYLIIEYDGGILELEFYQINEILNYNDTM